MAILIMIKPVSLPHPNGRPDGWKFNSAAEIGNLIGHTAPQSSNNMGACAFAQSVNLAGKAGHTGAIPN